MITTTLAIFAIMATALLLEEWFEQLRTYWPEEELLWHLGMTAMVMAMLWATAFIIALPVHWLTGAAG